MVIIYVMGLRHIADILHNLSLFFALDTFCLGIANLTLKAIGGPGCFLHVELI